MVIKELTTLIDVPDHIQSLISGGLAGMVAKSVVAPLDRVKILFQVSNTEFRFNKIKPLINKIVSEEGVSALWKGNTATLVRVAPYAGVQFMVYDTLKKHFKEETERQTGDSSSKISPLNSMIAGSTAGASSSIVTYPLDLTRARLAVLHNSKNDKTKRPHFGNIISENFKQNGVKGL